MTPEQERRPDRLSLEEVAEMAKETALRDGHHHPTLIIEGSKGGVIAVIEDMARTHEGRINQLFAAGAEVGKDGQIGELTQVFLISEAWMSGGGDKPPTTPPSADPNRKEVLLIMHSNLVEAESEMKVLEMRRESTGNLSELRDFEEGPTQGVEANRPLLAFIAGFRIGKTGKLN